MNIRACNVTFTKHVVLKLGTMINVNYFAKLNITTCVELRVLDTDTKTTLVMMQTFQNRTVDVSESVYPEQSDRKRIILVRWSNTLALT